MGVMAAQPAHAGGPVRFVGRGQSELRCQLMVGWDVPNRLHTSSTLVAATMKE